ncbi:hypothetical protein ACTFIY_007466 [Dictyostelium cf. discoideum]
MGLSDPISLNREITYPFIITQHQIYSIANTYLDLIGSDYFFNSLRVNQTYLDNQGPIFEKIEKIGVNQIFSNVNGGVKSRLIGWNFFIKDDYNGFERGFIKVIGSVDNSIYSFNFTSKDFSSEFKYIIFET